MERVTGIEPALSAWKAEALPLSYTRAVFSSEEHVYSTGFFPVAKLVLPGSQKWESSSGSRRSSRLLAHFQARLLQVPLDLAGTERSDLDRGNQAVGVKEIVRRQAHYAVKCGNQILTIKHLREGEA